MASNDSLSEQHLYIALAAPGYNAAHSNKEVEGQK